jgi:hypothetical protein
MTPNRPTIVVHGFKQTFEKNKETGNYDKPTDWVTYSPIHAVQSSVITDRISAMMPPASLRSDDDGKKMEFLRHRWEMIERPYRAWKEGIEIPLDGTPLGSWPAINSTFVQVFHDHGIKTIERVASLPESMFSKIPLPNVRELARQAQLFLENIEKSAASNRLSDIERSNAELKEQLAAAMALLEQQAGEQPKRGRRKQETMILDEDEAA